MKKIVKLLGLAMFILPLTLIFDLVIYGVIKTCPTCGNFWQFVETEGSLSFPIVAGITEWIGQFIMSFRKNKR
jgi:hypothetical protein